MGLVKCGIDRLEDLKKWFAGKRLGLITGASGVGRDYRSSIDILREKYTVTALFSPEHGVRGELQPGARVETQIDRFSGLPAYSLFEDEMNTTEAFQRDRVYMPPQEALEKIDLLAIDLQDVGSRYYTFASTLFYAMRACAQARIPLVVLDRPNPVGGVAMEGNTHREENLSFIGLTHTPIRHGLTFGELALYFNGEYHLGCDLKIGEIAGWKRDMYFPETGLPFICPSPNLPSMEAIVLYNGVCLLAGTNVTEGRGTTKPFEQIGAPFINPLELAAEMNALKLPGIIFRPVWFQPQFSKFAGQVCAGVQIHVLEAKAVQPVALGVHLIRTLQALYPDDFAFNAPAKGGRWHIDLASGTDELRMGKISARKLIDAWQTEADAFRPIADKYRLYEL